MVDARLGLRTIGGIVLTLLAAAVAFGLTVYSYVLYRRFGDGDPAAAAHH